MLALWFKQSYTNQMKASLFRREDFRNLCDFSKDFPISSLFIFALLSTNSYTKVVAENKHPLSPTPHVFHIKGSFFKFHRRNLLQKFGSLNLP